MGLRCNDFVKSLVDASEVISSDGLFEKGLNFFY